MTSTPQRNTGGATLVDGKMVAVCLVEPTLGGALQAQSLRHESDATGQLKLETPRCDELE
jgi:hypothetical protein